MRVLAIRSPRAMCALPSMLTICSIRTTRSTAAMSRSPTITRLTSLAQESGACRWPSTSKIAIVEMKHLLPALLLAGLGGHAVGLSEVPPADPPRLFLLGTAGGPIPRQERSQPANALVIGGKVYLIDAGDGLLRQMAAKRLNLRSEEHTSELQSLMSIS